MASACASSILVRSLVHRPNKSFIQLTNQAREHYERLGHHFILLGIGSFVLPMMDMQFSLISIFGDGNEAIAGGVFIAIGVTLFLLGARQQAQGRE